MLLEVLFDFTGRLHPAIVHLPIGILLLACFFELFTRPARYAGIRPAIQIMVFWGMLSAVFALISGLLLENSGEYEEEYALPHQWTGIAATALASLLFIFYKKQAKRITLKIVSVLVLLLVGVTGHLGNTVSRGPEFLTEPFNQSLKKVVTLKPIPNIQQAPAYNNVIQPILEEGCNNCHGVNKQKGKLRLDNKEAIEKGGKNGKIVVAGKPEDSEMIKRLLLPVDHEDHMPPKSKAQLTKQQISVLQWWVSTGADFTKKVGELKQAENIKPALLALETGIVEPEDELLEVPAEPVVAGDSSAISKLFNAGVVIMPVARNSNYLSASFVTVTDKADSLIKLLTPLKKQLIALKLDASNISDASLTAVAELVQVRRLQLSNTAITDAGLLKLRSLKELTSLNVVGTKITAQGIIQLKELKTLKYLYLYKTSITAAEREELKKHFTETTLDFGNYSLPMLAGDTTEVDINQ